MLIVQRFHSYITFLVMLVSSWIAYFAFVVFVHYSTLFNSYASMSASFYSARFWLNFFIIVGLCGFIDFTTHCADFMFNGTLSSKLQIIIKERGSINSIVDLPREVMDYVIAYEKITSSNHTNENEKRKYARGNPADSNKNEYNIVKLDKIDGKVL